MSEPAIDYYHAPETSQRRAEAALPLSDEIERFIARGGGDLQSRELLAQARALLRAHERERALYWDRLEGLFARLSFPFLGYLDDGK